MRLTVVDVSGREMSVLAGGLHTPGSYKATWSGAGQRGLAPTGLYFVRYQAEGQNWAKRITVVR